MKAYDRSAEQLPLQVVPFRVRQAPIAGSLRSATQAQGLSWGLSLGDRCCLALATEQPGAQVVTADRLWA